MKKLVCLLAVLGVSLLSAGCSEWPPSFGGKSSEPATESQGDSEKPAESTSEPSGGSATEADKPTAEEKTTETGTEEKGGEEQPAKEGSKEEK